MQLESIIGLEIHVQLKTKSKMFCPCDNRGEDAPPNTTVCPICMGHPGVLPVPNSEAIRLGVKAALALNCTILDESKFDRKHYFYPDLPKGYQISQYDEPVGKDGFLEIETVDHEIKTTTTKKIRLERLHLEEDAAKLLHGEGGYSYVDFNRAGTPLAEIVTRPDFRNQAEAKVFLQELRLIMRYCGISDADMEKGHLRCDANISLRPHDSPDGTLYPKTELKNLNSFRAVERALEYEIKRQTKLWETNTPPAVQSTRGWDEAKGVTVEQRIKEEAHDYRYFPEPDIPPMHLQGVARELINELPELPGALRERFVRELHLTPSDARIITDDPHRAQFAEATHSELVEWLHSSGEVEGAEEEILEKNGPKLGKLLGGWITSKLLGVLAEHNLELKDVQLTPENFAEFITLIYTNKISSAGAHAILKRMIETGKDPSHIMEDEGLGQISDRAALDEVVERIIRQNPDQIGEYKAGKTQVLQYLVGMVMKATEGKADPKAARNLLEEKIKTG